MKKLVCVVLLALMCVSCGSSGSSVSDNAIYRENNSGFSLSLPGYHDSKELILEYIEETGAEEVTFEEFFTSEPLSSESFVSGEEPVFKAVIISNKRPATEFGYESYTICGVEGLLGNFSNHYDDVVYFEAFVTVNFTSYNISFKSKDPADPFTLEEVQAILATCPEQ